ncbi:hypothetical protein P168DRAFT_319700 [Aspergillus campestris IBT 28561]|uniref:Smr domain protein n=1 Tax=Aspergillus campestris (strain IBT 28561) TaxID=1392248 RepID=A0A2I1CZZ0_ASPC2|nr:uncharacterized protein P168DRAFT_319700 [Aspergillus campestris IBT 28561]PKY03161.1 hypothetical protein P168DRAFT_319700 [Aspergillus campestris IBT 28561]
MDDKGGSPLNELEKEYCPPLDAALFTAIAFDYDVADSTQLRQLRDTLDALKLSAWEQEDLPFDPSGTSGLSSTTGQDLDGILSERSVSQNDARSRETDITSLTSDFSSVSVGDKGSKGGRRDVSYIVGPDGSLALSGAKQEDKIYCLTEMFPSVADFTIRHTLEKADGDLERSMDVLLNLAFFDEQSGKDDEEDKVCIPKGVDGFGNNTGETGRKKGRRNKQKKNKQQSSIVSSPVDSGSAMDSPGVGPAVNKWDAAQKDVDFIHSRTAPILKKETVKSAYHTNGASLPVTIRALAEQHAPKDEQEINQDSVLVTQVAELTQEFPSVAPTMSAGLLKVTRGSVSAASELAAAMITSPMTSSVSDLIKFTASPPPLDLDDETSLPRSRSTRVARDFDRARSSAGAHFTASAEALSKASVAYRRGRSDRLMGGAAAYYSAVGRDHLERAKRDASDAADALVHSQSTSDMLDLHGVSVQDAVRIASDRVSDWWDSLGDSKYMRGGAGGGYRIVTGLGRHSHDGTSRLGPAVGKMLAREGWRVAVGQGVLTVLGPVRHR